MSITIEVSPLNKGNKQCYMNEPRAMHSWGRQHQRIGHSQRENTCSTPECKEWHQVMSGVKVIHIGITEIEAHIPVTIHKNK